MWVDYLLQHYHSPRILPILLHWPSSCPHPLCDLQLNDEESFYYHLSDIHSLRRRGRGRKTGNQKRKRLGGDIHNGKKQKLEGMIKGFTTACKKNKSAIEPILCRIIGLESALFQTIVVGGSTSTSGQYTVDFLLENDYVSGELINVGTRGH
jgi:hypothetical protein